MDKIGQESVLVSTLEVATETGPIATETGNILLLKYFGQSKVLARCSRNVVSTIFGIIFLSFLGHILLEWTYQC